MLSISDNSLGVEGSMSEIGILPPHNSDKLHAPVAVNYHTIPYENALPMKQRALLSERQVKYVDDIIVKIYTANMGI